MPRNYYIVEMTVTGGNHSPSLPSGVSDYVGTDSIGLGCFFILSTSVAPGVPVIGQGKSLTDLQGLTGAALFAELPIRLIPGISQSNLDELASIVGFNQLLISDVGFDGMRVNGQ